MKRVIQTEGDSGVWTLYDPAQWDGNERICSVRSGDQLQIHHKESNTTLVIFVQPGEMGGVLDTDHMMLDHLRGRLDTLQRLVDQAREGGGGGH